MDYIFGVESVSHSVRAERGDLVEVHRGLELVLAGWRLHSAAAGREWDVLGTAVQTVAEDFHDRAPIVYSLTAGDDAAEAWRRTVQLVRVIADRMDELAGEEGGWDRSWWAATAAARLRAALPVPS